MIFYFSATGNCKYVAERLAAAGEKLIPIADCLKAGQTVFEAASGENIGFVCPTYFWGLPSVAEEFLRKLSVKQNGSHYTYFVATYGTTTGNIAGMANDILKAKGLPLGARFSVKMPDTWTPIFDLSDKEKVAAINKAAEEQISLAAKRVSEKARGDFIDRKVPRPLAAAFHPTYERTRQTKHFNVESSCIGCGLCAKKCPVQAIEMRGGRPVWTKEKCAMCLGCLHRCPKFAIQYGGKTRAHGQYRNPNTKI